MRNYYSYKDNREKVIQSQLNKVEGTLQKQNMTPALLLVRSNIASQMVILTKKKGEYPTGRATEALPKRFRKGSAPDMSKQN